LWLTADVIKAGASRSCLLCSTDHFANPDTTEQPFPFHQHADTPAVRHSFSTTKMHISLVLLSLATAAHAASPARLSRHGKLARRAESVHLLQAALNCTTLDYATPASLAEHSLNATGGCGQTYKVQIGDVRAIRQSEGFS
jgi:hypothetical protein